MAEQRQRQQIITEGQQQSQAWTTLAAASQAQQTSGARAAALDRREKQREKAKAQEGARYFQNFHGSSRGGKMPAVLASPKTENFLEKFFSSFRFV